MGSNLESHNFWFLVKNYWHTQKNFLLLLSSVKSSADKLSISMLSEHILMVQKLFWECIFKCTNSLWSWNLTFTYRIPKWTLFQNSRSQFCFIESWIKITSEYIQIYDILFCYRPRTLLFLKIEFWFFDVPETPRGCQ